MSPPFNNSSGGPSPFTVCASTSTMASMAREFCRASRASEAEAHAELGLEWRQRRRVLSVSRVRHERERGIGQCRTAQVLSADDRVHIVVPAIEKIEHLGNQIGAASLADRQTVGSAQVEAPEAGSALSEIRTTPGSRRAL